MYTKRTMYEPWNDPSLRAPPIYTSICDTDSSELSHACAHIVQVLSKQSPLHKESALLSRFLYKYDKKFRNDIGYRNLKKVNTAVRRYLVINLLKDIENFSSLLPSTNESEQYLPTKQMLQYILLRLMTFGKLMLRLQLCSKQAAIFYLDRVKRGESHWMSLMPFALLSRIWSISMLLLQHSCSWYSQLCKYLSKLPVTGSNFLPLGYKLPEDMGKWLDIRSIDNLGRFEWSKKKCIDIDKSLLEDDHGDLFENMMRYVDQIHDIDDVGSIEQEIHSCKINTNDIIEVTLGKDVDKGEVISRESFKSLESQFPVFFNQIQNKTVPKHSAENVTSKQMLSDFIIKEEQLRNKEDVNSLTCHLSFMQWHALKNSLLALNETLSKNRKIERKFKQIWKEKCLDYIL